MRRVAMGLAALLAACGSGGGDGPGGAAGDDPPTWVRQVAGADAELRRAPDVDGQAVWVRDQDPVVYVRSCSVARRITSHGGPYSAIPADQPGGPRNGYAHICQDE